MPPIDDSTRPRVAGSVELTPRQRQAGDHLRMVHDHFRSQPRQLTGAVEDLRDRLPMTTALEVSGLERRMAPEVETGAYFVVSEAMVNAVKHAAPTTLSVSLRRTEDRLDLEVTDDGAGGAATGAGLRGMADRVHALGGRLVVDSRAGGGTRVEAVIPCAS